MAKQIDINNLQEFKKKCDETYAKIGQGGGSGGIVDLTPYVTANDEVDSITFSQEGIDKMNEASVVQITFDMGEGAMATFNFSTFHSSFEGLKLSGFLSVGTDGELWEYRPQGDGLTYNLRTYYIPAKFSLHYNRLQLSSEREVPMGNAIYFNRINGNDLINTTMSKNIELFPQPPMSGNYVLKSRNGVLEWVQE